MSRLMSTLSATIGWPSSKPRFATSSRLRKGDGGRGPIEAARSMLGGKGVRRTKSSAVSSPPGPFIFSPSSTRLGAVYGLACRPIGRTAAELMILPRIEQADVPLSVEPEQIRVRRLIQAGFEVDLFAGKERQRARLSTSKPRLTPLTFDQTRTVNSPVSGAGAAPYGESQTADFANGGSWRDQGVNQASEERPESAQPGRPVPGSSDGDG